MAAYNIDIPEIVVHGIPRASTDKTPPTTGNTLATAGSRILDTLLGIGSAYAAVELDNKSVRNAYGNSGNRAGYYRGSDGAYHPIPTDANGVPLPGYSQAGIGLANGNVLMIGAVVVVLLMLYRRG